MKLKESGVIGVTHSYGATILALVPGLVRSVIRRQQHDTADGMVAINYHMNVFSIASSLWIISLYA